MGNVTTTYDILTRYMVQNQGGPHVVQMTQQVRQLERESERAKSSFGGIFGRIGAGIAGYLGFQQASKHLVQFNSGMEQAQIQMAGLMAQAGRGDYVSNLQEAATLVKQMQLDARASVGTTQDFVKMASMLIQPLTMAGGSMQNLRDMTKQSVVASQSMGIAAEVAARDVDQAIRGQYHAVDQFSGKLLTPLGYGGEEGRKKFNAMSMQQRMAEYQRALGAPAIAAMAKGQENSWGGVSSTLVDTIQMGLGKVGMPLFKGITAEVKRWNEWLDQNREQVDHIADVAGNKLLQAAVSFKNAIGWAAEHWKTIAASYAAMKAAGYLAHGTGGLLAGAGAGAGGAGPFGQKVAAVSIVASAVYIGATELAQYMEKRKTEQIASAGRLDAGTAGLLAGSATDATQAKALKQMLISSGLASSSGMNMGALSQALGDASVGQRRGLAQALGLPMHQGTGWRGVESDPAIIADAMAKRFAAVMRDEMVNGSLNTDGIGGFYGAALARKMDPLPKAEKPKVNVTINRIEVASEDPDRFVFRMVGALRNAAKNPSGIGSSLHALSEG